LDVFGLKTDRMMTGIEITRFAVVFRMLAGVNVRFATPRTLSDEFAMWQVQPLFG
jgi:hypothetical protein